MTTRRYIAVWVAGICVAAVIAVLVAASQTAPNPDQAARRFNQITVQHLADCKALCGSVGAESFTQRIYGGDPTTIPACLCGGPTK